INHGSIFFIKKYVQDGLKEIFKLKEGDMVTLKKGDIRIEIEDIKNISGQTYIGKVLSVTPYGALKKDNITDDSEISFSYGHIFSCHH
ncbi:MAG: hypothetical protein KJ658_16830, partial [Proteobacteria bacterium]|nr:hypothetical protein [Pseudomonadota bacterium]